MAKAGTLRRHRSDEGVIEGPNVVLMADSNLRVIPRLAAAMYQDAEHVDVHVRYGKITSASVLIQTRRVD